MRMLTLTLMPSGNVSANANVTNANAKTLMLVKVLGLQATAQ